MQFKSLLFLIIVVCVGWSVVVSCVVFIDGLGEVKVRSELPEDTSVSNRLPNLPLGSSATSGVINALNYFLPAGIACLALLMYIHRTNPVGPGLLMLAAAMLAVATLLAWEAGRQLQKDGPADLLARHLWWY